MAYHDEEWGVPVHDDRKQFEFLTLESAQAGLSWLVVLRKREAYRRAFAEFRSREGRPLHREADRETAGRPGHHSQPAQDRGGDHQRPRFLEVQEEFGTFDKYIWGFVGGRPIQNRLASMKDLPATSKESDALSKDLKQRGFKFVGSTIIYAHMQAVGMVNDHLVTCFRHKHVARLR